MFFVNEDGFQLIRVHKSDSDLNNWMRKHYSQPGGFVGRQLIYRIYFEGKCYGATVGGSATRHLLGRSEILGDVDLNRIVNNTFFHVERDQSGNYPCRNFVQKIVAQWRVRVLHDWPALYKDPVEYFETLVELPRTGEVYKRDGWKEVGITKGFTCKRVGGVGTDSWSGKRVWNTSDLRPKRVFVRAL